MPGDLKQLKKSIADLSLGDLERLTDWCSGLVARQHYEKLCDDTKGIHYKDVLKKFQSFVGKPKFWRRLEPEEAACAMQMFYEEVRVRGCRFEDDADMLLVEWGPENKKEYALTFTRQLIPPLPDGSQEIWQLRLELRYPLTEQLRKYEGNRWCESLKKVDSFIRLIYTARPFTLLEEVKPSKVHLTYGDAE